jgi:hypothetical protein
LDLQPHARHAHTCNMFSVRMHTGVG